MKKRFLLPLAVVGTIALTVAGAGRKSHDAAVARNLTTFNSLVKALELNYVDTIRTDEAFSVAIDAMLSTVDPYTEYFTADEQENLDVITTGEYGGIGSYILERDGKTVISGPYQDSPAAKAGLKSGDRIIQVDTTDVSQRKSSDVISMLRGKPNTDVRIRAIRPYAADSIVDVVLTREKLVRPSVPWWGVVDGNTGYVQLTSFINKSPDEVRKALESFKSDPNVTNVVLDLRGNGGGILESAVEIVGFFVPKGTEVLRTRGKEKASERIYKTTKSPILPDMPLAVLIDGGSASASEITAGALQDLDRAVLVGSTSFGKGLVQTSYSLPYDGVLKVTIAKYYLPSGRLIQALDYSRRNADGSVARTPDSLTNVYKTLHGREVRDGGGLKPDVEVDWGTPNRLTYNVVRDHWDFDFATKYASEHDTIPAPKDFEITDEIYDEFKSFIDPNRFKYDKVCEDMMSNLRKVVKTEGYMNAETEAQLDSLSKLLVHDLNHDLDVHRDEISTYLASEIVSRYYYDAGKSEQSLRNDKGFAKAREVLLSADELKRILGK